MSKPVQIFLCHASEDKPKVVEVYRFLQQQGFKPWLDKEDLLPGQRWDQEIPKALQASDFVLIFFSQKSTTKRGYVQKEFKLALEVLDEIPDGQIFVIPVRLDECEIPERFQLLHCCDLFDAGGPDKVVRAIRAGLQGGMKALRQSLRLPAARLHSPELENEGDNMNDQQVAATTATKEIELHIDRDFYTYSSDEQEHLLNAVRELLGLTGDVSIKRIRRGSVRLSLELTPEQAERLYWAVKNGALKDYGVLDAVVKEGDKFVGPLASGHTIRMFETSRQPEEPILMELTGERVREIVKARDYFDASLNPHGKKRAHQYEAVKRNGERLVIDHATGLTWQQGGSRSALIFQRRNRFGIFGSSQAIHGSVMGDSYEDAKKYTLGLNLNKFAGHSDWRLPTLDEAMSLVEPERNRKGLYIDPIFDKVQSRIWTANKESPAMVWLVDFGNGTCGRDYADRSDVYVRAVRSGQS